MTTTPDTWAPEPEHLSLGDAEAHVWRAALHQQPEIYQHLLESLSPDERQRACGFRFERDRLHFVVARGGLRSILGRYLGLPPSRLRFSYSRYGKPVLADAPADDALRFNLSHAGGVALYVVTRGREVGIDIESVREDFDCLEIAKHFFSHDEIEALRALPPGAQTVAFFNCWTRKEAYIKALGEGLSHPLHTFTVSIRSGEPTITLSAEDGPRERQHWTLRELSPGADLVAAVAIEGDINELSCWHWEPRRAVDFARR